LTAIGGAGTRSDLSTPWQALEWIDSIRNRSACIMDDFNSGAEKKQPQSDPRNPATSQQTALTAERSWSTGQPWLIFEVDPGDVQVLDEAGNLRPLVPPLPK
jgi:hypothetical protein